MENKKLKETYNKIAESWHKDHQTDNWWQEGTDKFVSLLKEGSSVLDVGCGGGTKTKYLINRGLKVLGVDFSENLIEIAKREALGGKYLVMDINNIDTLEENFDGVFMQAVLLHIPKKEAEGIIKKAVQKLNAGGYLYIAVKEKIEGGVDEETKVDNDYGYEYERFFSYFTLDEFKEYFRNAGLEMVYENVMPPSRTTRKSKWMQVIGKK
ncbi:MAG: class I SAM-dependent methyltransferase [bacterium]|nr:class I SAM-dependent methyltransferase [bacterium]